MAAYPSTLLLDSTLGAAFLGTLATSIFYGITSVQTLLYFQTSHQDTRLFKSLILALWVIDTVHLGLTAHGLYFYLVTNFGNFEVLLSPTWTLLAGVYATGISDLIVRSVFARRVWLLSSDYRTVRAVIPLAIILVSLFVFSTGFAFASKSFELHTFRRMNDSAALLYCSLGGSVVVDVVVATSLCILLFKSRTGFKRTDSLVATLMAFTVNTGLITSICAIACFVTYALWPQRFIFMGIYFALGKLYVNSLLASLNARNSLRDQSCKVSTIPSNFISNPVACYPMQSLTGSQRRTLLSDC